MAWDTPLVTAPGSHFCKAKVQLKWDTGTLVLQKGTAICPFLAKFHNFWSIGHETSIQKRL